MTDHPYVDFHQPAQVRDSRWSNEPRCGLCPELPAGTTIFDPDLVVAHVAERFCLSPELLRSSNRERHVAEARDVAWWLLRRHSRGGTSQLSRALGRSDHSTALRGIERCEKRRKSSAWLQQQLEQLEQELEAMTKGGPGL